MKARKNSPGIVVGRLVAVLVLAVGAPCALGQVAQVREQRGVQEAVARLKAEAPQAIVFQEGPRITRVAGQPLGFGTTPAESAAAFVQAHSTVFGLSPEELSPGSTVDGAYARPLMYEPETGTYKFTLVYYSQYRDSLPVYRADLRVLVRNEDGYPVVWAGSSLRNLGGFTMPAGAGRNIAEDEAHAAAARVIPGLVNFGPSDLVIWAGVDDTEVSPAVAIAFVADNGRPATAQYEKWLFVADAATGAVLYREDRIIHTDVVGSVHGMATTIPKADFCNPEVDTPMPWAKVTIGGTTVYADASGDFTIPNGGSSPVTVTSYMGGQYFVVNDQGGPLENLSMTVTPPGPANFLHNAANTSEFIRAEVNGYVQANVIRDWVLSYVPDYPTISTQTGFPIYVNINDCCNAYYDGGSINFYRACGGCANTAYSNVVHHEYGHHLVECAGSGQEEYGEGMSDSVGMLIADDPVCGYGFEGDCAVGIRSGDNDLQYPCSGEIHYCGQLLSGCIWSTRNELAQTDPNDYLNILSNLTINSILLHEGGEITPTITIDFLTLDDDDSNPNNGTPHWAQICAGFGAHNMDCPPLPIGLGVTPAAGLQSSGPVGGPFMPDAITYTLENLYDTPIDYAVSNTTPWVSLSNAEGTLEGHAVTTVIVSINADANSLLLGVYTGTVTFTNTTDHQGDTTRPVTLDVGGLIAYWPADECSGNVLHDSSGHGNNGTISGANWVPGPCGCGLEILGTDIVRYIPASLDDPIVSSQAFTAAAYVDWYGPNEYGRVSIVFDARSSGNPCGGGFVLSIDQNGKACMNVYNPGRSVCSVDSVRPGFTHVAATFDAAAQSLRVFIDGHENNSITTTGSYHNTVLDPAVGNNRWAPGDHQWAPLNGAVDELRIFDRALEAGEVCQLYSGCAPPTLAGDMNCDGAVDFGDINPFVLYLSDFATWQATYCCPARNGDINGDGSYPSSADINPFVALLAGQ